LLGLCCSCAGDLKDPERFDFLVNGGSGGSAQDAGVSGRSGGGGSAGASTSSRTPPACVQTLLKNKCALAGCHATNTPQMDFASPGVEDRLIGKSPSSGVCQDKILITTDGSPSLLTQKLMDAPPCGTKMPLGGMLPASDVSCVTDWVNAVGKNGGR
jgi:hypothetical protein